MISLENNQPMNEEILNLRSPSWRVVEFLWRDLLPQQDSSAPNVEPRPLPIVYRTYQDTTYSTCFSIYRILTGCQTSFSTKRNPFSRCHFGRGDGFVESYHVWRRLNLSYFWQEIYEFRKKSSFLSPFQKSFSGFFC